MLPARASTPWVPGRGFENRTKGSSPCRRPEAERAGAGERYGELLEIAARGGWRDLDLAADTLRAPAGSSGADVVIKYLEVQDC